MLINLVGNAVKYTERGRVILRVGGQRIEDSQDCRLVMEVQDGGIGIASGDQARIFEPFIQAGKLSKQKGTGLGLAITKRYVELMGGTIQVESAPGKGSLFRVEIPVLKVERSEMPASGSSADRSPASSLASPNFASSSSDQEENWLLLQRLLKNAGFQVQVAEDGATGIEKFLIWRPHFIWMDWRLPSMDGLQVTCRIRELEGGRDVKIVILSAFAFTEYRDEALAAGVDDFVGKPFRAEEIFDCLTRHLGVAYTYHAAATEKTTGGLGQEQLADLSAQVRKDLSDALIPRHQADNRCNRPHIRPGCSIGQRTLKVCRQIRVLPYSPGASIFGNLAELNSSTSRSRTGLGALEGLFPYPEVIGGCGPYVAHGQRSLRPILVPAAAAIMSCAV